MGSYIVLDLEWNQGTARQTVDALPFEVIEIGAVKLNEKKEITGQFESLIRPSVYQKIFYMTAKVINITMDELKNKDSFPVVIQRFLKWCGEDYIFCTWGSMDITELRRNIDYHKLQPLSEGPLQYLDIQKLYSLELDDGKSRRSLEKAVDALEIEKEGDFHRADSDAYYTAEIFRRLQKRELEVYYSYDVYRLPSCREKEIHSHFPTYSKYISKSFKDKHELLKDKEVRSLRCFNCDEKTSVNIPWVSVNGKQYFAMGKCREHGMMRGHLRVRKAPDGGVYAMKTIRPAKAGDEGDLKMKQKTAREQEKKFLRMLRNNQKSKSSNSEK
ncbi:MAG: exonuclease domain-containing protein [Lachnospiraceae bacterium]|nr:exonuclease domain-containing protein [Lachnospiraceae bacterium]